MIIISILTLSHLPLRAFKILDTNLETGHANSNKRRERISAIYNKNLYPKIGLTNP